VNYTYDVTVGFESNGTRSLLDSLFSVVNLQAQLRLTRTILTYLEDLTFGVKGATVLAVCRRKHAYSFIIQ
jgi:hypothetical protein